MPVASLAQAIPFFDYPATFQTEEEDLLAIVRETGRRGAFILQKDLARFERNLAEYLGSRHALGVANATDGLLIALRAAGLGTGAEIIFSSHTMVATAAAIHFSGATPVPVECAADHLIDPDAVEEAVTPRTRAILVSQLNGRTADMEKLGAIATRRELFVIEDAAQALGSKFRGRSAGTFGLAGAISFYPAKMLGCLGDGGAVTTNDDLIQERMVALHDHGRGSSGEIAGWGLNSRLDNVQAAILDYRLKKMDAMIQRRRHIAAIYRQYFKGLDELVLPPGPEDTTGHFDVYQNYEIEADRRDALRDFLKIRGIGTILPWGGKAVHQWPSLGFRAKLPFTEALFDRLLLLPLNLSLTDDQVTAVSTAIREFYRA